MNVTVKLVGALARHLPDGAQRGQTQVEVAADTSIDGLIGQLGLPEGQSYMVSVNDEFVPKSSAATHVLNADDRVSIMPSLKGG